MTVPSSTARPAAFGGVMPSSVPIHFGIGARPRPGQAGRADSFDRDQQQQQAEARASASRPSRPARRRRRRRRIGDREEDRTGDCDAEHPPDDERDAVRARRGVISISTHPPPPASARPRRRRRTAAAVRWPHPWCGRASLDARSIQDRVQRAWPRSSANDRCEGFGVHHPGRGERPGSDARAAFAGYGSATSQRETAYGVPAGPPTMRIAVSLAVARAWWINAGSRTKTIVRLARPSPRRRP